MSGLEFVTTPYCSGLSLLLREVRRGGIAWGEGNHPLLFGTVSPTSRTFHDRAGGGNVTTPYCSGLSLLLAGVSKVT